MLYIIIAVVSFLIMVAIIFDQILNIRRGLVGVVLESTPTLAHRLAPKIENTALGLTLASHRASAGLYLRMLIVLWRAVSWFKILLHKFEARVSSLISAARVGRVRLTEADMHRERGSVSFFLAQIKDHQDELSRRASRVR